MDRNGRYTSSIVHCILNWDRIFQKKISGDLSHLSIEIEPLGLKADEQEFKKMLSHVVKVESVHDLDKVDTKLAKLWRNQCFVFQYETAVYLYTHYESGQAYWEQVSVPRHMKKVQMRRGLDNKFYFVESDNTNTTDTVIELHVENKKGERFEYILQDAYVLTSGQVLALEIDQDHTIDCLLSSNYNIETNKIFVMDDSLQLYHLREEIEDLYTELKHENLADVPGLSNAIS